jgi:hypothetical protein
MGGGADRPHPLPFCRPDRIARDSLARRRTASRPANQLPGTPREHGRVDDSQLTPSLAALSTATSSRAAAASAARS